MTYMKKVSDAKNNPGAGPGYGWFKIAEAGLVSSSKTISTNYLTFKLISLDRWAVDDLISAGGIQTARIPQCIANGDYLLRFEVLALHR